MSLNTYLDNTASNLIIKGDEKDAIAKSLDVFKSRMENYFFWNETVNLKEIKVFGSYARDTDLPQAIDSGTDVDIMLVMDDDGATPQTYLDRVRRAVEAKYSTSDIKQSSPTIVLQMNHIKFEITPAIQSYSQYKIKDQWSGWMYTNCLTDFVNLKTANTNNYCKIKPVIRLVKYWNKTRNGRGFASYQIEKNIVDYYQSNRHQEYDTKRYLLTALQCLRSLPIYEFQRKTLESASSNVQEAINDEEQFPTSAMSELKKVRGEL